MNQEVYYALALELNVPNEHITLTGRAGECVWVMVKGSAAVWSAKLTKTGRLKANSVRVET